MGERKRKKKREREIERMGERGKGVWARVRVFVYEIKRGILCVYKSVCVC